MVTVAVSGDFGKPRPAVIVQADQFEAVGTIAVLLISNTLVDAPLLRLTVPPSAENGLLRPSQVMIDKIMSVKRDKIGTTVGRLDDEVLVAISRSLAVFLGIA